MTDAAASTGHPDPRLIAWAGDALDERRTPEVRGLRDGGQPWLLSYADAGDPDRGARRDRAVVLRVAEAGPSDSDGASSELVGMAREIAGMTDAAAAGIPVPAVLADTRSGKGRSPIPELDALLIEYVDGTSVLPVQADPHRLEEIGAVAARIARVPVDSRMPVVAHPIPDVDFAALRADAAPQPLMVEAERLVGLGSPSDPIVFVHGDLWSGNTLWRGELIVAVLDWDCAGRGAAGVDLGSLRSDAAMCFGPEHADDVLRGWEREAGHPAASVAYWDVMAALSTPPDISWFAPAISGMTGRPDLTAEILRERRDVFLADAIDRLRTTST